MPHNLPAGIVAPLKDNPEEGYEQDIDIHADSLAANGFYPQNATSNDGAAGMYRDADGNLVFKDATNGSKTLSQLASGGGSVTFGSPVAIGTANADGVASSVARADHVHAHGTQTDGSLHAAASTTVAGFMSAADKSKLDSVTSGIISALAGSAGAPSGTNKYVTDSDSRLTNSRTPNAHASSHTAAGSDPLTLSMAQITGLVAGLTAKANTTTTISAGDGLTGGGDLSSNRTISLPMVGMSGSYGSATQVPVVSTDAHGRVTSVSPTTINITTSNVSDFTGSVQTLIGSALVAGSGIGVSTNALLGTVTVSNTGVLSVNGSTGAVTGVVTNADYRLTDARTPTSHASSHAQAGTDPIQISQSQVDGLVSALANKVPATRNVIAGTGLTGGGGLADDVTLSLENAGTAGTYGSASSIPVLTTDAKGRVTAVTNTAISITSSNISNFSTAVKAVLETSVSAGTGISTSFNAGTGVLTVTNSGVTSVNGGTGAISSVALTTGKLSQFAATTSAELLSIISDETGSGSLVFGTAPTLAQVTLSAGTTTTVPLKFTAGTNLTTAVAGAVEWDGTSLYLTQTTGPTRKTVAYTDSNITGGAAMAGKLSTAKTFALTGDVTGSASSDLASGLSIAATLASVGSAGTYGSASSVPVLTTDAKGRVTGVTNTSIALAQSAVTNLVTDLAAKAADLAVVHLAGTETITGAKKFTSTFDIEGTNLATGSSSGPATITNISSSLPSYPGLTIKNYSAAGGTPGLALVNARGTSAAPAANQSADVIGNLLMYGHGSSLPAPAAYIKAIATANSGTTTTTTALTFGTANNADWAERMRIAANGNVGIGGTPAAKLHTFATNENLRMQGNDPWFTFYTAAGVRKGWIGYGDGASTTTVTISNETTSGSIRLAPGSGGFVNCTGTTVPNTTNTYQLGTSGQAWSQVWCNAGAFNTSDARAKTDIQDTTMGLSFIEALRPVSYKFKVAQYEPVKKDDGTEELVPRPGVRPHQGFLAQEVKEVMDAQGIEDFAGYGHDTQNDTYALRYEEFVAPLVKAVQELSAKVKSLEAELAALKAKG